MWERIRGICFPIHDIVMFAVKNTHAMCVVMYARLKTQKSMPSSPVFINSIRGILTVMCTLLAVWFTHCADFAAYDGIGCNTETAIKSHNVRGRCRSDQSGSHSDPSIINKSVFYWVTDYNWYFEFMWLCFYGHRSKTMTSVSHRMQSCTATHEWFDKSPKRAWNSDEYLRGSFWCQSVDGTWIFNMLE